MNSGNKSAGSAANYRIRNQEAGDAAGVFSVNAAAFAAEDEARLVERLCTSASPLVSLLAEDNNGVIGHILFSPVALEGQPELKLMGLAPMAVVPERQNSGIGSALVRAGSGVTVRRSSAPSTH